MESCGEKENQRREYTLEEMFSMGFGVDLFLQQISDNRKYRNGRENKYVCYKQIERYTWYVKYTL